MTVLPTGTVTFFFSDIEGSTRLLEALGPGYDDVLERHHRIAREAFNRCAAVELGTEGDSFFAVFPAATDAVSAAVAIQQRIAAERWPEAGTLRVRIGLHTGEARIAGGDYVGLDVHRAARIMAAAHGGQILASEATRTLVDRTLADGVELRDLGLHRLRDLSSPERLFQVVAPGLPADFPVLRSLDATPNNLPTQTSDIVGRHDELEAIGRHLGSRAARLVTLTGPGGIGKTRLALQAAADAIDAFPDGVYFVDLAASRDPGAALQAIVRAVGVALSPDEPLRDAIVRHLGAGRTLLVLDNFEQVMPATEEVAALLGRCSALKIVVTSREALRIRGEQLLPIAPLSLPEALRPGARARELASFDAVRLFVERAREARPAFELTDENAADVADICASLDGLPLAIELAAARLKVFSTAELRDRLRSRLQLLRGGARDLPARQQTLRGTIEWSHELLDEEERQVFRLLSVFASARVQAVEELVATLPDLADIDVLDRLVSLVDKSLVRSAEEASGQRLSMLGTIREYAAERLAAEPSLEAAVRRGHAAYFADFARSCLRRRHAAGREAALDELASELGNLQVAWAFFVASNDLEQLNKLVDPLWALHDARGWYHGAVTLANNLLGVLSTTSAAPDRAEHELTLRMSLARALLALRGYTEEVELLYRDALALADSMGPVPKRLPVLRSLASFYLYRADIDRSAAIGRQILDLGEQEDDPGVQVEGLVVLGPATAFLGDVTSGLALLDRAMALFDPERQGARLRLGPSPGVVAPAISGLLHWLSGYPDTGTKRAATALDVAARLRHPYSLAYATFHVALLDFWTGRIEVADRRAAAVRQIADEHDYQVWRAIGCILQGATTAALGEPERGLAQTEEGIELYENLRTPPVFWSAVLALRALVCATAGRTADAFAALDEAASLASEPSWDSASLKIQRADLLVLTGDPAGAETYLRRAFDEAPLVQGRILQLQAATRLARLERGSGRTEAAEVLRQILETFTEGFGTVDLVEARAVLAGT